MGLSLTRVDIDPLRKMDFFRHCPECGRRFQIRLVDKKLVRQERGSIPTREIVSGEYRYGMSFRGGGTVSGPPTVVLEGRPIVSGFLLLKDSARLGPIRMMVPKMATIVPA